MISHLFVFDPTQVAREKVRDMIDRLDAVKDWTLFFGNTMCLASELDARALSKEIRRILPPDVRFVLTTIDGEQKGGWLPGTIWDAMEHPAPAKMRAHA